MSHEKRIKDGLKMFKKIVSKSSIVYQNPPSDDYIKYISDCRDKDIRKRKLYGHTENQTRHAGGGHRNKQTGLHGQINKTKGKQ